jgi:hypothetical protein
LAHGSTVKAIAMVLLGLLLGDWTVTEIIKTANIKAD